MSDAEQTSTMTPDRRSVLQAGGAAMVVGMTVSGATTASAQGAAAGATLGAVSYTHLTLPTILRV